MNKVQTVVDSLNGLAKAVIDSWDQNTNMSDNWGWNAPVLNRHDIAQIATMLARRIALVAEDKIAEKFNPIPITTKIDFIKSSVVPQFWNGNCIAAFQAYQATLSWIDSLFSALIPSPTDWEKLNSTGTLPKDLGKKLKAVQAQIKAATDTAGELGEQISVINSAHDAALSLPTDLETLIDAKAKVEVARSAADKAKTLTEHASSQAQQALIKIQHDEATANKLIENIEDAYSAATTKGLGQAFQERADKTSVTMWIWVGGLVLALGLGAGLGTHRVTVLETLLATNSSSGIVSLSVALALLSVAAPVWFAWIATKQIGQRFRLAEDYAYKASVARAYEGYRREAARLDPEFAARLFKAALNRLDEEPLRYVEHETHGSPWHEWAAQRRRKTKAVDEQAPSVAAVPPPTIEKPVINDDAEEIHGAG